ncbi:HesA/MoeB/ThiF family protein [Desertivirga xinjiangensis]|uniref:HesA/MoeB/ThiF family protein n=1 Tax=Desertivirga xinjiangensis TaxID=539206 RepID=UPI00210AB71F|nr:HesA/MoeB/ThiF family protein [Pedobacter xinjiangensis]
MQKEELKRYQRQIILSEIGLEGQKRLKTAKVLVIGAGGLGCPLLQYLAAAGVGNIGIVDDDKVDESNLHRQILYSSADIGKSKAEVAAEKLRSLNPFVNISSYPVRLQADNAEDLFSGYELVVDGSDNFATRYLVNDTCVRLGKPLVFGSIFGFEGQVSVFNYRNGPTFRCVFPEAGESPNCAENGVLGVLPGIIGSFMANEALKIILSTGESLSGKLLIMNVLENTFNLFKVSRLAPVTTTERPESAPNTTDDKNRLLPEDLDLFLENNQDSVLLVDVREPIEFEADGSLNGINIPLSEIPDEIEKLVASGKKILFYCNSGKRSKQAFSIFKNLEPGSEAFWI